LNGPKNIGEICETFLEIEKERKKLEIFFFFEEKVLG